ncbi:MAG: TetR/AcrR family transcriptional regulator [Acidimicrobiaceae bacterium]
MSTLTGGARPSSSRASQRRRAAIEEATLVLLRARDAAEVSVSDIADQAEVSVATVYNLIGTRDRLLAGVHDRYLSQLAVELAEQPPALGLVSAASTVITTATDVALRDPLPLRAVVREVPPLELTTAKGTGVDQLIEPRLCAAGASLGEAREVAQLIVYGFWGTIVSWALGLISDARFRDDAELVTKRLVLGTFGTDRQGG